MSSIADEATERRRDPALVDKGRRLIQFLAASQRLQHVPVRTVSTYASQGGSIFWLGDAPQHPAVTTVGPSVQPGLDAPFLVVDRVDPERPPQPAEALLPWLDGPIDEPNRPRVLLESLDIDDLGSPQEAVRLKDVRGLNSSFLLGDRGDPELPAEPDEDLWPLLPDPVTDASGPEERRESAGTDDPSNLQEVPRLGGDPYLQLAYDEWQSLWFAWAERERANRPVRQLYRDLFGAFTTLRATGKRLHCAKASPSGRWPNSKRLQKGWASTSQRC